MASRLNLHAMLLGICNNTYFQPPESFKFAYPAIVYSLSNIEEDMANNETYRKKRSYSLTYICPNPDDPTIDQISQLPYCSFDRHYKADNLNHYVYTIYY